MMKIKYIDGKFLAKGTFDMGIAGIYENKEYGEEKISFSFDMEELKECFDDDYMKMNPFKEVLKNVPQQDEAIVKALEDYYNTKEWMVQKNIKQMNDYFLYQLLTNLLYCEYPFWEVEQAILPEYQNKYSDEDYLKIYEKYSDEIVNLSGEYDSIPNDGSAKKTDVEAMFKRIFPMFDLDGLIKSIEAKTLYFEGAWLTVEFSDTWGCKFFCSAYEQFDENLCPRDWHNF